MYVHVQIEKGMYVHRESVYMYSCTLHTCIEVCTIHM